ncbi:MAG: hypothetical protein JOZ67_09870 [Gammaproteobacteria bacterium]|nr:hypothetical protein [Gammaproteobacteria bacterium]
MRFRLRAFTLHLAGSACALTLILGGLYLGWYRWPGWYLTAVAHILIIVGSVDLALGPTLTLIVANPQKPRRELTRDIAIIVAVQLIALGYGALTLWHGRPLYYTLSSDRLELVQGSDISESEAARARRENPALAPHWYSRPRWVWAPLPDDPEEAARIVNSVLLGKGVDVIAMPRYYRPWEQGQAALRAHLRRLADTPFISKRERPALEAKLRRLGLAPDAPAILVLLGGSRHLLAVFDPQSAELREILRP